MSDDYSEWADYPCILTPEVLEFAETISMELVIAETSKAIKMYNRLATGGLSVVAMIHSTC